MELKEILKDLLTAPGVTGNEEAVRDVIRGYFETFADKVYTDTLGNLYGSMGSGSPVVLICAHMDEIGMMVDGIEEDGRLHILSVAGVDPRVLPGSRVEVLTESGILPGVVGAVPPHLLKNSDRDAAYKMGDLLVDTGLSPEKVKEKVHVGDFVCFALEAPLCLKNGRFAGKTMDDRSLVAAEILSMEQLSKRKFTGTALFCATVQEERGCFGAKTGAAFTAPDMAIAMDVCHAPTPGTDPFDTVDFGKIALAVGGNIHPGMAKKLMDAAAEAGIAYQTEAGMYPTGTDASELQVQQGGIPTGLIELPLRYMHTAVECVEEKAIKNCAKLLTEFMASQTADFQKELEAALLEGEEDEQC